MQSKILKILTVILTIMALTMSNFITVGIGLISYAEEAILENDELSTEENEEESGTLVSKITAEENTIYKGKLNLGLERNYNTTTSIKFNMLEDIENIQVKEENTFGTEEEKLDGNIYYAQTTINKENLVNILGENGELVIHDQNDQVLARVNSNSEEDENANIVINYNDSEVTSLTLKVTNPVAVGELEIKNTKTIKEIEKDILQKATNISSTLTQSYNIKDQEELVEETKTSKIEFKDATSQAKLEISNEKLSTLKKNENVQLLVTLQSATEADDLYKNPNIDIIIPQDLQINVKKVAQLNYENEIKIKYIGKKTLEDGRKVIHIETEGEQLNYVNETAEGIQIAIIADIEIPNTVPSKEETIQMLYTNENREAEQFECNTPINITSKYGVLMVNKLENYNNAQDVKETTDNQVVKASMDQNAEAKLATQTINIINNYENEIKNVVILGTVENDEATKEEISANLQNIVGPQNKQANIYYANDNEEWTQNVEEVEEIKTFKIEVQDIIQPQENLNVAYNLYIPENVEEGSLSTKAQLQYEYLENNETTISTIELSTDIDKTANRGIETEVTPVMEEMGELSVSVMAKTGESYLNENDTVLEGQGIKYTVRVKNNTDREIQNIVLEATNTNAIYYGEVTKKEEIAGVLYDITNYIENEELDKATMNIELLKPGETKEVSYQIAVKEVEDDKQMVTGNIKVKANNIEEKTIKNISSRISTGKLKLTLKDGVALEEMLVKNGSFDLVLEVKNISETKLSNVIINLPIAEEVEFSTENFEIHNGDFIEYVDRVAKFKINEIPAGETEYIYVKTLIQMESGAPDAVISEHFTSNYEGIEYISNYQERKANNLMFNIVAKQTTNILKDTVTNGDNIIFTTEIERLTDGLKEDDGTPKGARVTITDVLPRSLEINSIKIVKNGKEEVIENNRILNLPVVLNENEKIALIIDTTLNVSLENGNKITHKVDLNGWGVDAEVNGIEFSIEEKKDVPIVDPDDENKKHSISGIAWIDKNRNGTRESLEKRLPNLKVMLLDEEKQGIAKDDNGKEISTVTDSVK